MSKILVAFSGGMDSAVLLARQLNLAPAAEFVAVGFHYGSKHNPYEEDARRLFLAHYNTERINAGKEGIRHKQIDITEPMKQFDSSLLRGCDPVPEGHYEEESMRKTVVPCRNMIFLSFLAGVAETIGAHKVLIGVHAGDHFIYPDCRPSFISTMTSAVMHATDGKVEVEAPFLRVNKAEIVRRGLEMGVPFHLTRTCYKDQPIACGKCGSCQERLEAFKLNGKEDPLEYECRELMPKKTPLAEQPMTDPR